MEYDLSTVDPNSVMQVTVFDKLQRKVTKWSYDYSQNCWVKTKEQTKDVKLDDPEARIAYSYVYYI